MTKEFENLFKDLLENGANPIELGFWKDMLNVLSNEEKSKLKDNLEEELKLRKEKTNSITPPNNQ